MKTKWLKKFKKRFRLINDNGWHLIDVVNVKEVRLVLTTEMFYQQHPQERYKRYSELIEKGIFILLEEHYGYRKAFKVRYTSSEKRRDKIKSRKEAIEKERVKQLLSK